jgi:hypothetical protein
LQVSAAYKVNVQVKNGLASMWANVEHGSVAILDAALARDIGGDELAAANQFGILGRSLLQPANMFLRNHKHVSWRLRVDIVEGVGMFVFVDFLGGNFSSNDPAEQTIVHDTVHSSK